MFVPLNSHSHYSFLTGANRIEEWVEAARHQQCPALALTDTNGLYGAVAFYRAARQAGIRPIFGTEIESSPDTPFLGTKRAVLLARDRTGFGEICRMVTDRHLQPDFSLDARLQSCSHHVIVLCADLELLAGMLQTRGRHNLYVEVTRHGPCGDPRLLTFAERHRLPCVATQRAFFISPEDWNVHRLLSAMRTRTTISTVPAGAVASREAWLKPPAEMARLFHDLPEAIRNTRCIAEQCDVSFTLGEIHLPPFDPPEDTTQSSYLRRLANRGLANLYRGDTARRAARQRLSMELQVIDDLGLAAYFLIVWDIVREATARGIPTVGRGSAANSLVCRTLGITQVDPLRHNLYFERFLSRERTDCPDIDIDFPWNRRDEMIDYVFDKYGHDHVALISTHVHFRSRSLIREVGKALGVPVPEIDAFTKTLPHFSGISEIETVRRTVPECRNLPVDDEPYRSTIALSRRIEGFPRHISIHCGGIVISPSPITDRIPLQKTPKGFAVTQYDMYPVEDMGLLKIDLLAQKGLAVLSDTVTDVRERYGTVIDFDRMDPVTDPKTRALVKEGATLGCFYIESPGMRNLLQKLGVESFEMLTAASSIIRPGVSESGMMRAFIERHNGREPVRYLHPKLEPILEETFGVMIYQEDVIKVAHAIAGMSLGEAEGLRKCMSKKRDWEAMENYRDRFLSGARANGVPSDAARELWRQMESFAGYAFCKAHSASFALVSYQTAWLKTHYPAEFMAAVLSNQGGFYDTCAYMEEARRLGLAILPPDVNQSEYRFTASATPTGKTGLEKTGAHHSPCRANAIRVGLMQVRQLSQRAIQSILEQRRGGPFVALEDFLARVEIDESETEMLIRCGACDGLGRSRPALLWRLKQLCRDRGRSLRENRSAALPGWRTASMTNLWKSAAIPPLPQYSLYEKLWAELECLDLTVSSHLLTLYGVGEPDSSDCTLTLAGSVTAKKSWHRTVLPIVAARHLPRFDGKLVTLAGWLITAKRTRTAKHELMKFMTLEDPTASFEVTLFPKVYRRFGPLLYDRGPYIVRGRVEREGACCTLTALWLDRL